MIFLKFLLGFLAVGHGANLLLPLLDPTQKDVIYVYLTLKLGIIFPSVMTVTVHVSEINQNVIPRLVGSWLKHLTLMKSVRAVFTVHFRAPLVVQGESPLKNMTHVLCFERLRNVNYKLHPVELSHESQLPFNGLTQSLYPLTTTPGSVVTVTVTVINPKKKLLSLQWVAPDTLDLQESRVPQVVEFKEATLQIASLRDLMSTPPALAKLTNPLGREFMSQSLNTEILEKYAEFLQNKTYFKLVGYFQPRHATTRLVLSSKAEVQAHVHVPRRPDYLREHSIYTLKAQGYVVCKHQILMNPNLFYKVEIEGAYNPEDFYGFSFMVYEFKSNIRSSPMILYFVDETPPAPAPAPAQTGNSAGIFDRVSSGSRPSSGLFDWSITGPSSEARNIFGIRPRPNSIFSNWLNAGPSSQGQDPGETQTKNFAKVSTNPSVSKPEEVNGVESIEPSSLTELHES